MGEFERDPVSQRFDLVPYAGRWVARVGDQIVAQGGPPQQALAAAKASRYKETPEVFFVPTGSPLHFSALFEKVCRALPKDVPVYLVGGAMRDILLARPIHDYDFVIEGQALRIARGVANKIGGAYFPLDSERDTGRVIYTDENNARFILDFAAIRGDDLEADLRERDFTINAMAIDVRDPQALLDPLGGAADLHAKILRACSAQAFSKDPVRILRAVRMAAALDLSIVPETRQSMKDAVNAMASVSPERLRDEILNILGGARPATSMRALDILGALEFVFPETLALKGLAQSPPHTQDVWSHTLDTLNQLEILLNVLAPIHDPDIPGGLISGLAAVRLGRYRRQIEQMLAESLVTGRSMRGLLFLAALYHDIGKPRSQRQESESGRIRFLEHERIGSKIAAQRSRALHLSNTEIDWVKTVVLHHMRPTWLAHESDGPRARAVYRFFRDTKQAGAAVCLVSLADLLATYGTTLPQERWERQLDVVRALLEAWWEQRDQVVDPPPILSGDTLIKEFGIQPGPLIGEILEALREAQAEGRLSSRNEALDFVKEYLAG